MSRIMVHAEHSYPVICRKGALEELVPLAPPTRQVFVLHQPTVGGVARDVARRFEARGAMVHLRECLDSEAGKTHPELGAHWDWLGDKRCGRTDVIVGVGGGAVTDMAGFVAATWMRGVRYVSVPTTVAAMVDAAVGGKTGLNISAGKNLAGAFWSPSAVVADTAVLETLPRADVAAGLAEAIKCGMVADPVIFSAFEQHGPGVLDTSGAVFAEIAQRTIAAKARIVSGDFREFGGREALNFGHTLGHAIERASGYTWRHGDAVAVGMRFACALQIRRTRAVASCGQHRLLARRLDEVLAAIGLPQTCSFGGAVLSEAMLLDKKNRDARIRFVLVPELGRTTRWAGADPDQLADALREVSVC